MATNKEQFNVITTQMANIYEKKNHDYGSSFDRAIERYGLVAASAQIFHKLNRFDELIMGNGNAEVADESVIDTLTDLANYAIMTRMYIENNFKKA